MENVSSSAILIVISTIIAALLMGAFLYTYHNYDKVSDATDSKIAEMDTEYKPSDYQQYIGSTIRGDKLRGLLKSSDRQNITIYVKNGKATATYDFQRDKFSTSDPDFWSKVTTLSIADGNIDMSDSAHPFIHGYYNVSSFCTETTDMMKGWYIRPFDKFTCTGSVAYGTVQWLEFKRI
jgi:hypothetical protein